MLSHRYVLPLVFAASTAQADMLTPDQFLTFDPLKAQLGQLLFYDKILSGNRNISCGTCHHHTLGSTDGLSLGVGEGGVGIGELRTAGEGADRIAKRIPRNAPALWNLGHESVSAVFHDGRVSISDEFGNGFATPAKELLPKGLDSIIAAQALFPMTSDAEMAGQPDQNEVAAALAERIDIGWDAIAARVREVPYYGALFTATFDTVESPEDVTIVEIGNAIAAFIGTEWQSTETMYDAYLRDGTALPDEAERGRELFFGKASCSACHNGPLFTDGQFHAVAIPAFGPGRTREHDPIARDVGLLAQTDNLDDAYRFKTPSLRNIGLTAPYGHNGAYSQLSDMIRHMADPVAMRAAWTPEMTVLPKAPWLEDSDFVIQDDKREMARQLAALDVEPVKLSDREIADIEAFLHCLTDKDENDRPLGVPLAVPSGLPVD